MATHKIIFDKYSLELGSDILEVFEPRSIIEGNITRGLTGVHKFVLMNSLKQIEMKFQAFNDYTLLHKVMNFWSWAKKGNPFLFAYDKTKSFYSFLDGDSHNKEILTDGDFEEWASGTHVLDKWAKTEIGATKFYRETGEAAVWKGLSAVKIDNDGVNNSYLKQTTTATFQGGSAGTISILFRSDLDTRGTVIIRIKNVTTGNWLRQDGSWGVMQDLTLYQHFLDDDNQTYGIGKGIWRRAHKDFQAEATTSTYEVYIYSNAGGAISFEWFDDFSIRCNSGKLPLASTYGLAADDYCIVESRARQVSDVFRIYSVTAGDSILAYEPFKNDYVTGDVVRHKDCLRLVIAKKQEKEPMWEQAGLLMPFEFLCEEYRSGRT